MGQLFDKYEKHGAYHWNWYDNNHTGYRDLVDLAISYFPTRGSVLDVGCGDGLISYRLFEKGLKVLGIDTNAHAIQLANTVCRNKIHGAHPITHAIQRMLVLLGITPNKRVDRFSGGELQFRVQSIFDLKEKGYFDYILCHDVIEHVKYPEQLLERIYVSMACFAIISTPNGACKKPREYDFQLWTPEEFEALLHGYRFEVVHLDKSKMYVKLLK